ncbi:gp17 [uncultured phage MedDCM-OCT-S05-C64]|nr:gp17 [uncultured phage MedDCM-OCT-S05-C64]BAR33652.1 putative phage minor tail protein [uncultured Mediterranean phage uvMED]
MATFPDIQANFGATKQSAPTNRVVKFGDGYEQVLRFGLNQNPKVWNLTWENISETDSDTIEAFLDARADDGDAFDWSPPDESDTYKWRCNQWSKTLPSANLANISATFRQVFEP